MKRMCIATLGALALPWLGGVLSAQEPAPAAPRPAPSGAVTYLQPENQPSSWEWSLEPWLQQHDVSVGNWEIGGGVLIAKPHFEDNTAFTSFSPPALGPATHQTTATAFSWTDSASPFIWATWKTGGFGIRAGYFTFDETSRIIAFANPPTGPGSVAINEPSTLPDPKSFAGPIPFTGDFFSPSTIAARAFGIGIVSPDHLTFASSLRLDTVTLEATEDFTLGSVSFLVSGGARYLYHRQDYHAALTNSVTTRGVTAIENDALDYSHEFNGGGPTASLYGRQPFGETGLSMYGNMRGSLLVGRGRQDFRAIQLINDKGISPLPPLPPLIQSTKLTDQFTGNRDDTLPVIELELGVEYGADLGSFLLFVQSGVVSQTYFGAGSAVSENGNMSLFGLQISVGFSR